MYCVLLLVSLFGVIAAEEFAKGVSIVSATRTIDISTQLTRINTVYEVKNEGSAALKSFLETIPADLAPRLAYIKASQNKNKVKVDKTTGKGAKADDQLYKVELSEAIGLGKSGSITVTIVFTGVLQPFPTHITQAEQQFVVFQGNAHVYSGYPIAKESTKVKLSPGKTESFTKVQPSKDEGGAIAYGPYENTASFAISPVRIHYENNAPFLTVTKLERLVEVSHWGNIAVEETLEVVHMGAILKGSFSRYDFQRDQRDKAKLPAVKDYRTVLPAAARDVYYRDEIGNISTSHLRVNDDSVDLEIRPRFPLFGGWKTNYYIGYNVPSYEYLHAAGNEFGLKMRFVDHVFDDFSIDELSIKIILPEGSKNLKLTPPYKIDRSPDSTHYTYLDTQGRPVITAHKSNIVAEHIQDFQLTYTFDRMSMFREPLMVIVTFYLLFLVVIVYVRLDFSISKDASSESRMKTAGYVEQLSGLLGQRQAAYDIYVDAIGKYKCNKDSGALNACRKKAEGDMKNANASITELHAQLKAQSPDSAEKLNEINRFDKIVKDNLVLWVSLSEKLVGGKVQKGAFSDQEKIVKNKVDEARDKAEQLALAL